MFRCVVKYDGKLFYLNGDGVFSQDINCRLFARADDAAQAFDYVKFGKEFPHDALLLAAYVENEAGERWADYWVDSAHWKEGRLDLIIESNTFKGELTDGACLDCVFDVLSFDDLDNDAKIWMLNELLERFKNA